jgi:hypothetical protein
MEQTRTISLASEDLSPTTPLWRYMKLTTLLMLLRGRVFIPTIATLRRDDPFEAICKGSKAKAYFETPPQEIASILERDATAHERSNLSYNNPNDPTCGPIGEIYYRIWDRLRAPRLAIWCWQGSGIESMALWNQYADRTGVAIRTNVGKLIATFEASPQATPALLGKVRYDENEDTSDFLRPYFLKRPSYEHESEVRLVIPWENNGWRPGILMEINAATLLERIVISPHVIPSEAHKVREFLQHALKEFLLESTVEISDERNLGVSYGDILWPILHDRIDSPTAPNNGLLFADGRKP